MAERQATVQVKEAKRQAIESRDSHFSALEWFVNRDLSVFLKQCPAYALFPETEYGAVEMTNWYREQLIKVWAGLDPAGIRLMILLGLRKARDWHDRALRLGDKIISAEATPEAVRLDAISWSEIVKKLKKQLEEPQIDGEDGGVFHPDPIDFESFGLPEAKLVPDWQRAEIQCKFETDFQNAIYCLMLESWRAKTCPNCRKYFVAAKSAQAHCSHECYVERKNKASLDYWKKKGKAKRVARTKRKKG